MRFALVRAHIFVYVYASVITETRKWKKKKYKKPTCEK